MRNTRVHECGTLKVIVKTRNEAARHHQHVAGVLLAPLFLFWATSSARQTVVPVGFHFSLSVTTLACLPSDKYSWDLVFRRTEDGPSRTTWSYWM